MAGSVFSSSPTQSPAISPAKMFLEVDQFAQWSRVIVAKHLVIILDACASGLALRANISETSLVP